MRYLGLANYFSSFVDYYAEDAPLPFDVLKGTGFSKKKKIYSQRLVIPDCVKRWGEAPARAWRKIKAALNEPEIFAGPQRSVLKNIMTDASAYGLGVVLLQYGSEKEWRPVSFISRLLKSAERN